VRTVRVSMVTAAIITDRTLSWRVKCQNAPVLHAMLRIQATSTTTTTTSTTKITSKETKDVTGVHGTAVYRVCDLSSLTLIDVALPALIGMLRVS